MYPFLIRVIVKKGRNNPLLYRRFVISSLNCLLSMSMFFSMCVSFSFVNDGKFHINQYTNKATTLNANKDSVIMPVTIKIPVT